MKVRGSGKLAGSVYDQIKSDIFEFRLLPGTRFSENDVKPRRSVNITVPTVLTPPRRRSSSVRSSTSSTTCSGMKRQNTS